MSRLRLLPLGLAAALGVLGAQPAAAAKKKPAEPAPAEAPPTATLSLEERRAAFGAVDEAFSAGRKAEAADLLVELVEDPTKAGFHAEAYFRLGGLLESFDLPYSALVAYERALATDAPLVKEAAAKAIALADKVGDTALLEEVFSKNLGLEVDGATRSRMAYLAAREAFARGIYPLALASVKMVAESDPYFPEAKAMEGVALSQLSRHKDALIPLQVALGAGIGMKRPDRFEDLVELNLGRAYYAAGNYARAMEYFGKVERGSRAWPEARFEMAWSWFRMEDLNGALGALSVHSSPFLEDAYFPEADLLRIYSLFLMCKFPEATKEIKAFQARSAPKVESLDAVAARSPQDLFAAVAKQIEQGSSDLPEMIWGRYVQEDRFIDSLAAVRSAEDERKRLANVAANPFSEWAGARVDARKAALIEAEGTRVGKRARRMADELKEMLQASEVSQLDMLDFEARLYQAASAKGEMLDTRQTVRRSERVEATERVWPWEGEHWADEIGYVRYEAQPECPVGMRAGG